ncbi:MAG TPA: cytochrome c oxidase assembly protein [Jatrophihabitans sp.]|jgi:putative copper resistance protein D
MDQRQPARRPVAGRRSTILATSLVALAALVWLGFAVAGHLRSGGHHHHAVGESLTRAGTQPAGELLGGKLFTAWQLDAIALVPLILLAAWYLTSVALAGIRNPAIRWPLSRTVSFLAGLLVAAYATCGAIAVFDQALFTAHMAGHLALVMLSPALLVAGRPLRLAVLASPPKRAARLERIIGGWVVGIITCPPVALITYTVMIVGTHLTGLMDTFMRNTWAGQLEHLLYLLAGIQFFVLIVGDEPIRWRLGAPARWMLLALAMAVDTFTGIVLMMLGQPIGMLPVPGVDVDTLSDTHTGGAIMWFGGDGLMAAVMVVLVLTWLRNVDTKDAERSWLERAREATLAEHTSDAVVESAEDIDEDEGAHNAYNQWLAGLDNR